MSIKKDFVKPIVVLLFICFFVSGALAIVNSFTRPKIDEAAEMKAVKERNEIISDSGGFDRLEIYGLPVTVIDVYAAKNGAGYIFTVLSKGFGRDNMKILCGIDMEGRVIRASVLSDSETRSFSARVFIEDFMGKFWRKNRSEIEGISVISGATYTSGGFKNAIRDALAAFDVVSVSSIEILPDEEELE